MGSESSIQHPLTLDCFKSLIQNNYNLQSDIIFYQSSILELYQNVKNTVPSSTTLPLGDCLQEIRIIEGPSTLRNHIRLEENQ